MKYLPRPDERPALCYEFDGDGSIMNSDSSFSISTSSGVNEATCSGLTTSTGSSVLHSIIKWTGTTAKMAPEIYRAVIDQAHKKGMRVAVHLFYLDDAKQVLDAGADFIAHSVRDVEVDDAFAAMLYRRARLGREQAA